MKIRVVLIFFICIPLIIFAQGETWTIAASRFSLDTSLDSIELENQKLALDLQSLLPQLLLQSFEEKYFREVTAEEQIATERYILEVKKNNLYKDYETSIQKRDSFIFENKSRFEINQNIKSEEKKILGIQNQIQIVQNEIELVSEKTKTLSPMRKKIITYKQGEGLFSIENKNEETKTEEIKVAEIKTEEIKKQAIELDALSKNIDALISGSMRVNGDFLQVSFALECIPQSLEPATFLVLAPLSDISYLVSQMHEQLLPIVLNEDLIYIDFEVQPPEAKVGLVLHIDDEVYKNNFSVRVTRGEHTIFAEVDGYEPLSFVHDFDDIANYEISLSMKKKQSQTISLEAKDEDLSFSLNAENFGLLPANVNLDEHDYLGQIEGDGWSNFFILKEEVLTQDTSTISYLNYSIEDKIKKSRNRLYFSYGTVLFALPLYLFSFAHYNTLLSAAQSGLGVSNSLGFWQAFSTVSFIGVSALGINMGLQLVFYLNDANKLIPK